MPIIKYKDVTLHFAHIPKCAGSSVEKYVKNIKGAELGFVDIAYAGNPAKKPWNISSPQHIDGPAFMRLFPKTFFDGFFAIVRNPKNRVKSAYLHQRFVEKTIKHSVSLDSFVKTQLEKNFLTIGWMDNHFLPQSQFFYPKTAYNVFKLEKSGAMGAKEYIDRMFVGNALELAMPHENTAKNSKSLSDDELELSKESVDIINTLYESDFKRFKYPLSD